MPVNFARIFAPGSLLKLSAAGAIPAATASEANAGKT
jgi:hypothetical protein